MRHCLYGRNICGRIDKRRHRGYNSKKKGRKPTVVESKIQVYVLTKNAHLGEKIRLDVSGTADVVVTDNSACVPAGATVFFDADSLPAPAPAGAIFVRAVWQGTKDCLSWPFPCGAAKDCLSERPDAPLLLSAADTSVLLYGRKIALSETEYALLERLFADCGTCVSKEELLRAVWRKNVTPGALTVYIHYLRKKLEGGGEHLIFSSRTEGYRLSEKLRTKGGSAC